MSDMTPEEREVWLAGLKPDSIVVHVNETGRYMDSRPRRVKSVDPRDGIRLQEVSCAAFPFKSGDLSRHGRTERIGPPSLAQERWLRHLEMARYLDGVKWADTTFESVERVVEILRGRPWK